MRRVGGCETDYHLDICLWVYPGIEVRRYGARGGQHAGKSYKAYLKKYTDLDVYQYC